MHELLLEHERGSGDALEVEAADRRRFPQIPRSMPQQPASTHRPRAATVRSRHDTHLPLRLHDTRAPPCPSARRSTLQPERPLPRESRSPPDRRCRAEHAERIVEADGGIAGVDEPAGQFAEPVEALSGNLVVDDDPFSLLAGAGDRGRAALEVADVVERVVAAEDVDAAAAAVSR